MSDELILAPASDEIHVWTVALDVAEDRLLAESRMLSPDELDRARRYRFERDRRRFVVSRLALRHLLGSYLAIDQKSVPLVRGPHGKPRVALLTSSRLSFNTSRSEDLAIFAVGHDREIGVDVERVREDLDLESLARRVLCAAELLAFGRLEPEARRGAFYRSWTRKEACLKVLGVGLTVAPDELDVTGDHVKLPTRRHAAGLPVLGIECSLHDANIGPSYAATLAVEGDLSNPPTMRGSIDPLDGVALAEMHLVTGRTTQVAQDGRVVNGTAASKSETDRLGASRGQSTARSAPLG